jgi:hypothetical protein
MRYSQGEASYASTPNTASSALSSSSAAVTRPCGADSTKRFILGSACRRTTVAAITTRYAAERGMSTTAANTATLCCAPQHAAPESSHSAWLALPEAEPGTRQIKGLTSVAKRGSVSP